MNNDSKLIAEAYSKMNKSVAEAVVAKLMDMEGDENGVEIMLRLLVTLENKIPACKEMLQGILKTLNAGRNK